MKIVFFSLLFIPLIMAEVTYGANAAEIGNTPDEKAEDVERMVAEFVGLLSSKDCSQRKGAIFTYLPKFVSAQNPFLYLSALKTQRAQSQEPLKEKLSVIINYTEMEARFRKEREEKLFFHNLLRTVKSLNERAKRLEEIKKLYLKIIKDKREDIITRSMALGNMIFAIDRLYSPDRAEREEYGTQFTVEWADEVLKLLKDRDTTVRLITALAIGQGGGLRGKVINKAHIIEEILQGLRNESFVLRWSSQKTLEEMIDQHICIDPTDRLKEREQGIKQWEMWWKINKSKFAREKLIRKG